MSTLKEQRKNVCKVSKVKALRKGRSGTCSQEKVCVKFSQIEGSVKAMLVTHWWTSRF